MMITPAQCRAARGLLGWTIAELAQRSKCAPNTVSAFEREQGYRSGTAQKLRDALEAAGVIFIPGNGDGPGVRLKKGAT